MDAALLNTALNNEAFTPEHCARLVIKIGSALLVGEEGTVRRDWLSTLIVDIAARREAGQQIIIVSSGAVALGARRLGLSKGGRKSLDDAQAAAAAGQIALSQCWAELLAEHDINAAQILVTLGDLEDRRRYLNAAATLDRLLSLDALPVVNENDSVATEEIKFGDNDRLAARIGQAAAANGVILLSDVDGLYTANPAEDNDAKHVPIVKRIDAHIREMADEAATGGMGSGGMASKLQAATIATAAGIPLAIISGQRDNPLAAYNTDNRGTVFAAEKPEKARKSWLAGRLTVAGSIRIDSGAITALHNGKSLLPAGAKDIGGKFERGDVVEIVNEGGKAIARGLVEYDSRAARKIIGLKTTELEAVLGYAPRPALIHRDRMVLL